MEPRPLWSVVGSLNVKTPRNSDTRLLILGIGNVLMGDEGVGVHVVRQLTNEKIPADVDCVDGGTGGFHLLDLIQKPERLILIDATIDGAPAGTVRRLRPRFSSDYPRTLCAHDIGLKDLLDCLYLLGKTPEVVLYAISIATPTVLGTALSAPVAAVVPEVAQQVLAEALKN